MRRFTSVSAACAAACLLAVGGLPGAAQRGMNPDQHFITEAARGGMAEVRLGELAMEKGQSEAVKRFGDHMVQDHSVANDQLTQIAARKDVPMPMGVGPKHRAVIDHLSGLSGAEFDRAYMHAMVMDHMEDVADFQKEARMGGDRDVRLWAAKTLPTLRHHLMMAQDTARRVGAEGGGMRRGMRRGMRMR
jgi:putative membrane protein